MGKYALRFTPFQVVRLELSADSRLDIYGDFIVQCEGNVVQIFRRLKGR